MSAPVVISLSEAKAQGLKRYFTGRPCKNGHVAERSVSSRGCMECGAESCRKYASKNPDAMREMHRRWRRENPEKAYAKTKKWRARNKDKVAQYQSDNREKIRLQGRIYSKENREKIRLTKKSYRMRRADFYREYSASYFQEYVKSRRGEYNARAAKRRAIKLLATPKWADFNAMRELYIKAKLENMHVDHIIPLQGEMVCGLHVENNLQLLTRAQNLAKNNKFDPAEHEWGRHVSVVLAPNNRA